MPFCVVVECSDEVSDVSVS